MPRTDTVEIEKRRPNLAVMVAGVFVWLPSVYFGMILLDIVYGKLLPESTPAFSDVSDFLLVVGFAVFCAAVAAIALTWKSTAVRNLFIASLLVLSLEILGPIFALLFVDNAQLAFIGPWLRLIPGGLASILALFGFYRYLR